MSQINENRRSWGWLRRLWCCGPREREPHYEQIDPGLQAASLMLRVGESVDEMRQMLATLSLHVRSVEERIHPLLLPEAGVYMPMSGGWTSPASAAPQLPPPRNVYWEWLQERVGYGEPW